MKILIIVSALFFSSSVLAHWTSPNGVSPKKEEVLPKDREPSSVQHEKPAPKKLHEKEKSAKGT